jgi:hypothetical protein
MKKSRISMMLLCVTFSTSIFFACKKNETPVTVSQTLYERVGGTTMVADPSVSGQQIEKGRLTLRSVVDSSILVIAADAQLAKYFPVLFAELGAGNTTGFVDLKEEFTDFLCSATGSKNTAYAYTGLNMKDAHDPAKNNRMGLKANSADFEKFVGDIGTGLAQNGVTAANNKALVDDLVALLYTTKADVVQQ